MRILSTLCLALALLTSDRAANASPLDMFGSGARGMAMGGAQTAATNDSSANYYNPALLAAVSGLEIDLGYHLALPVLRIDGRDLGVDSSHGGRIALAMPGRLGPARLGVGISLSLPDQHLMRVRTLNQQQPRFSLYDNRAQRLYLSVNAGFAIGEKFSIGGGLGYVTGTSGDLTLAGRVGFPDADDSDLRLDMDVDITSIAYINVGMAYELRPWLRVGFSYRGGVQPNTDLSIHIEGDIGADNRDPIVADAVVFIRSASLSHFQPAQFNLGFDARLSHTLTLAGDLSYHRWSQYENPAADLTTELELGEFNDFVDPPSPIVLAPTNFHDILIPRLGIEWLARKRSSSLLHLRAGYYYEPSPAPEQIGVTNFVDNDKHTATMGAGLTLPRWGALLRPLSFDAAFAVTSMEQRGHRKLSPVDPVGDYRSDGTVWQVRTTARFRF